MRKPIYFNIHFYKKILGKLLKIFKPILFCFYYYKLIKKNLSYFLIWEKIFNIFKQILNIFIFNSNL